MSNQTNSQTIQQTLIEELGLSGLPQEKQNELMIKMTEVVLKRVFLETVSKLNEEDQEQYSKMIEENSSSDEMENFFKERIPDYDAMIKKIVDDFKEEMKKDL